MHRVMVDKDKNRLYLTLGKLEDAEEISLLSEKIRLACQDLNPGFYCLNDMREYELIDEKMEVLIKSVQQFLVDAGMAKVVRVVRKFGAWGHVQFDNTSMNVGYHAEHTNSIEEAMAMLNSDA